MTFSIPPVRVALIELPRKKRREGIKLTGKATDKLAEGLSRKLIIPEQMDTLADTLAKEPALPAEQAVKRFSLKPVAEEEISRIIQQRLKAHDMTKLQKDEAYRKFMVPKIVGEVLKAVNYSVEGKKIAEQVQTLIHEGK